MQYRLPCLEMRNALSKMPRSILVLMAWFSAQSVTIAQQSACFTIQENPFSDEAAFSGFSHHVHVLSCFHILSESGISDAKLLHVAAVAAELLDQNEDGRVDDPRLQQALAAGQALMPILNFEGCKTEEALFDAYNGKGISAVLYADEIDPQRPGHWGSDATVEEVLHTINHVGHVAVYPEAFSLAPNSSLLSVAMDVARGGQFDSIPGELPENAWYHYDDETCDYACMAIEYLYWAIVSKMGILNDSSTARGIADEWELYSPELLESEDTRIYALITDAAYRIPLLAPDGNYCP